MSKGQLSITQFFSNKRAITSFPLTTKADSPSKNERKGTSPPPPKRQKLELVDEIEDDEEVKRPLKTFSRTNKNGTNNAQRILFFFFAQNTLSRDIN